MKKFSEKRSKQNSTYSSICKEIDQQAKKNDEWVCFFCGLPLGERADHHHLLGRDGDLFTDKRYIVLAHNDCHVRLWHGMAESDLSSYWWYDGLKNRLEKLLNAQTEKKA